MQKLGLWFSYAALCAIIAVSAFFAYSAANKNPITGSELSFISSVYSFSAKDGAQESRGALLPRLVYSLPYIFRNMDAGTRELLDRSRRQTLLESEKEGSLAVVSIARAGRY